MFFQSAMRTIGSSQFNRKRHSPLQPNAGATVRVGVESEWRGNGSDGQQGLFSIFEQDSRALSYSPLPPLLYAPAGRQAGDPAEGSGDYKSGLGLCRLLRRGTSLCFRCNTVNFRAGRASGGDGEKAEGDSTEESSLNHVR